MNSNGPSAVKCWQDRLASGALGENPKDPSTWVRDEVWRAAVRENPGAAPASEADEDDPPFPPGPAWPELETAACYGLAGDVMRLIEPTSEADPVALLAQFLVGFGNACGRTTYYRVENTRHHLNLFVLLVGRTARGRKGTSWRHVRALLAEADEQWAKERIMPGLSSGEGLVWQVRDPIFKQAPIRDKGRIVGYEDQLEDPGVTDKRLLCLEEEFAAVLRLMKRDGNTLSATMRQAWDGSDLRIGTKNSPAVATAPLISVTGHSTQDDLQRELDRNEVANGYLNRFLLVCVRRSKELPDGGAPDPDAFGRLAIDVQLALDFGRRVGELQRDPGAREWWAAAYSGLTADRPGLLGAVTARAEAHVTRLASVYAVLDRSGVIRVEHLEAAAALWRYCEASAAFLFGCSLGDPLADDLLAYLRGRPDGASRTEVRDHFSRSRSKAEIDRAGALLLGQGLLEVRRTPAGPQGGRPREVWAVRAVSAGLPSTDSRERDIATTYAKTAITPLQDTSSLNSSNDSGKGEAAQTAPTAETFDGSGPAPGLEPGDEGYWDALAAAGPPDKDGEQ